MSVSNGQFTAAMKRAELSLGSFSQTAISVKGVMAGLASALALRQAGRGLVAAASASSNLNEQVSKSQVVFGAASARVEAAAKQMGDAFGYPKSQFIEGASSIGLIAKASGLSQSAAADMGVAFGKLSADASSFFNVPVEEALMAIRSGLVGEAEPMRRFGVLLNETSVKAEAARMGFKAVNGALTEGQKVQARASLITRGLADAQGDMARTAGSAANKIRTIWGRLENLGADLGTAMQPATDAILGLADNAVGRLSLAIDQNKDAITGWVQSGIAKVMELGFIFRNLPDFFEIAGIMIGQEVENMSRYFQAAAESWTILFKYVAENWAKVFADALVAVGTMVANLGENLKNLASAAFNWTLGGEDFNFDFTPLLKGFEATAATLPDLIEPTLVSFQDQIDAKIEAIGKREAEMAAKLAAKAPVAPPKAPGAGLPPVGTITKKSEKPEKPPPRFAAAIDARSAEAISMQLKFLAQAPARRDEPIKEVVKKADVQIDLQARMANALEKLLEKATGKALELFQIS